MLHSSTDPSEDGKPFGTKCVLLMILTAIVQQYASFLSLDTASSHFVPFVHLLWTDLLPQNRENLKNSEIIMIGFSLLAFLLAGLTQIDASRRGDCRSAPSASFRLPCLVRRTQLMTKEIDDWDSSMSVQQVVAVRFRLSVFVDI